MGRESRMDGQGVWKQRQQARTEGAISAAKALFLSQGIEPVTMTDIADAAGIGVASLYRYPATATKTKIVIAAGISLWHDLMTAYNPLFQSGAYTQANGYGQMTRILSVYPELFQDHRAFIRFLSQFDAYCLVNRVPPEQLEEYEQAILAFYPIYDAALRRGRADGSLRGDFPGRETYFTVNHALMSLMKKLAQGAILAGDAEVSGAELTLLIDMVLRYVKG